MAAYPLLDRAVWHGDRIGLLLPVREPAGGPPQYMASRALRRHCRLGFHHARCNRSAAQRMVSRERGGLPALGAVDCLVNRTLCRRWGMLAGGLVDANPDG